MWWGTLYLIFQKPTIAYDPKSAITLY